MQRTRGIKQITLLMKVRQVRLLSKHVSSTRRSRIRRTEAAWERYARQETDINELLDIAPIRELVERRARHYGRKWAHIRLTEADFSSLFWQDAWETATGYTWAGRYYLYEMIDLAIRSRAYKMVRAALAKKRQVWSNALPLADGFESWFPDPNVRVEDEVIARVTVEAMFSHWSLTEQERVMLHALYQSPDASLQELADMCGLSNKVTAGRMKDRLRVKLAAYNPFATHEEGTRLCKAS